MTTQIVKANLIFQLLTNTLLFTCSLFFIDSYCVESCLDSIAIFFL